MLVRTHHTKCTNMSAGSGVERGCSGQDAHWSPSWDNSNVLKPLTSATTSCGSMRWTNRMPKSREWWVGWLASCSLRRKGGETRGSKGGWGGEKGEVRRERKEEVWLLSLAQRSSLQCWDSVLLLCLFMNVYTRSCTSSQSAHEYLTVLLLSCVNFRGWSEWWSASAATRNWTTRSLASWTST